MPVSNLNAPVIFATSPDIARHFWMRETPQLPLRRLVPNIFNTKAHLSFGKKVRSPGRLGGGGEGSI